MKKIISKRFGISAWDLVKTVGMFFIATFGDFIWQYCDAWLLDQTVVFNFKLTLRTSIITTVGYFVKQWASGGKEAIDINKLPLLLIGMMGISMVGFAGKPVPVNDTLAIPSGRVWRTNVLYNDEKPTEGKLIVTGFTVKTTTRRTPGTTVVIAGVGTVKLDSSGVLLFIPYNDTFIGDFPAMTYTINNSLPGNGISAKLFLDVFKPVKSPDQIVEVGKTQYGIVMECNGFTCFGNIIEYYECDQVKHGIWFKDAVLPLWVISDTLYQLLK